MDGGSTQGVEWFYYDVSPPNGEGACSAVVFRPPLTKPLYAGAAGEIPRTTACGGQADASDPLIPIVSGTSVDGSYSAFVAAVPFTITKASLAFPGRPIETVDVTRSKLVAINKPAIAAPTQITLTGGRKTFRCTPVGAPSSLPADAPASPSWSCT